MQTKQFVVFGLILLLLTGCGKAAPPILSATPELTTVAAMIALTNTPFQVSPTSVSMTPSPTAAYVTNCALVMPASPHGSAQGTTTVTYLANSGFLITIGEKKILIDGLPEKSILAAELPAETVQNLLEARPPFEDIDLILVTHSHWDHFSVENTLSHLQNNPKTSLVSTEEVVQAINAADQNIGTRLVSIQLRRRECRFAEINGIGLQILSLSHGSGSAKVENLGLVITIGGVRLFHSGDMEPDTVWLSTLQSYGLPELGLDVAFLPEFMFTNKTYHARITAGIRAAHLIPMHFMDSPAAQILADFPQAILFNHGLETWTLP